MGNKPSPADFKVTIPELQRTVQAGDLLLISTTKSIESDIRVNPSLLHSIQYSVKYRLGESRSTMVGIWDSAGIIVDMVVQSRSGKCLLELGPDGFTMNELLGRLYEFGRKKQRVAVRYLDGERTTEFRTRLKNMADSLAGKTVDELVGTDLYRDIRRNVDMLQGDTQRDTPLYMELKQAFYLVLNENGELAIKKDQLFSLVRDLTGLKMDIDSDELAEKMGLKGDIEFEELWKAWTDTIGKEMLLGELYEPSLLAGRFLLHVYTKIGVVFGEDLDNEYITPDDFATSPNFGQAMRNPKIFTTPEFAFYKQNIVILSNR